MTPAPGISVFARLVRLTRIATVIGLSAVLSACANGSLRQYVPPELADEARVVGIRAENIRFWGDEPPKNLVKLAQEFRKQQDRAARGSARRNGVQNMLAISGGGSDGAFGAGLLNGWTQAGNRPRFAVVTGVSTGALMAPFAFLGARYDHVLKELYTKYSTQDILRPTILAGLIGGGSAVGSSEPLAELIKKYLTRNLMRQIAAEHAKGRRLLVGTTNLDAERPVIWNMGQIASQGSPRALALMRSVLLASASIPGVFPPVLLDVVVDGKVRQEMHVDGGTTDNAILLPIQTNIRALERAGRLRRARLRLYVIVNSHTNPEWENVKSSTVAIAGRSIATLIKQQTIGDVLKLYGFSRRNGIDFNMATIPADFTVRSKEPFDRNYMTKLYQRGERLGRAGYRWRKRPIIR